MTIAAAIRMTTTPSTIPTVHPVEAASAVSMSHLPHLKCPLGRALEHALRQDADDVSFVVRGSALIGDRFASRTARASRPWRRASRSAAGLSVPARRRSTVMSPPTAASPSPARAIVPSASKSSAAPAATTAQSPTRRSTFEIGAAGARMRWGPGSRRASRPGRPRSRTDRGGSRACRRRVRRVVERMTSRASTAAQTAERSSDGSAWQSAPPIVPRLRTTGSAITRSASVKIASLPSSSARVQQRGVARHRADPDLGGVLADVAEHVRQRVDVDHVLGLGDAQLHHRQQAVAAGEQPGFWSERFEQRKRLLDARRTLIPKRCWDLQDSSLVSPPRPASGVMVELSNRVK